MLKKHERVFELEPTSLASTFLHYVRRDASVEKLKLVLRLDRHNLISSG